MTLIIAEKPSLARNIASAIGGMSQNKSKGGGFIAGEKYIVTWAFGHLFSLCDIEDYSPAPESGGRWTMSNLPCFPKKFRFALRRDKDGKPDDGVRRQFETISALCRREDVDTVINAGDSDREGEVIIRIIIDHALGRGEKSGKRLLRLWMPDQTPETIRAALADPPDESEYDNLAYEGYARTFIDWLYGVNLTRFATLKSGTLLRVGRVIVPIVRAIYERDMAIKDFTPEKYYSIRSCEETGGGEIELCSKARFDAEGESQAQTLCGRYNAAGAVVSAVKRKTDTLAPGKLYSLTKLQNHLGKKYKMPMNESLEIVQKLYEAGYVTYPRTNSEYLATAEREKIGNVIGRVAGLGYPVCPKDGKQIFDDSKIESHSALTPTVKIPDKSSLTAAEAKVYGAIMRRFVAVFCAEKCVISRTTLTVDIRGEAGGEPLEQFALKGNVIVEPGWTRYDDYNGRDRVLPALKTGERVNIDFKPVQKETSPPKHYTIETLNNYLKNPFREERAAAAEGSGEGGDDEDYRAIFEGLELGTEATRTGIIDNARKSGYIQLKGDVYTILPDGCYLIESLARMGIGMDKYKTAEVGRALKRVFRGEMKITESLEVAQREIAGVFERAAACDDGFFGDDVGVVCPLCGSAVMRGKYGYVCRGYKNGCKLKIGGVICGRSITLSEARALLGSGTTGTLDGFVSKAGKPFSGALRLEGERAVFDFSAADAPREGGK